MQIALRHRVLRIWLYECKKRISVLGYFRAIARVRRKDHVMSLLLEETQAGKILEIHATGKLAKEDYQHFVPEAERLIRAHGKIRILFDMSDFHGWETGAIWEDLKFDAKHFSDFERIAMVGEKKWQKAMSAFCRPFTTAKIRYFEHSQLPAARAWLNEP